MPGPGEDGPLSVESLNSTSYNVEGDGPKTEPSEVRRTWYGKKKKELKDGTGTLKPVRQVKVSTFLSASDDHTSMLLQMLVRESACQCLIHLHAQSYVTNMIVASLSEVCQDNFVTLQFRLGCLATIHKILYMKYSEWPERFTEHLLQHRKYARFKKILNIGEKLKPLGLDSSEPDNQSQARDQPDDAAGAIPQAEHVNQDNARSEAINKNLETAAETRDLYIQAIESTHLVLISSHTQSFCLISSDVVSRRSNCLLFQKLPF